MKKTENGSKILQIIFFEHIWYDTSLVGRFYTKTFYNSIVKEHNFKMSKRNKNHEVSSTAKNKNKKGKIRHVVAHTFNTLLRSA